MVRRENEAVAQVRILSIQRRPTGLYRELLRHDGNSTRSGHNSSEIPVEARSESDRRALARFHPEAEKRDQDGVGEKRYSTRSFGLAAQLPTVKACASPR